MVEPDDLANLCVIFFRLRARSIERNKLIKNINTTLRIDSRASSSHIINEAMSCDLIYLNKGNYFISDAGRNVGRYQKYIQNSIHDNAKEALIRNVYLNRNAGDRCCAKLLLNWMPDSESGTFVYKRRAPENAETLFWLQTLERVGLIEVDDRFASISTKYLSLFNKLLYEIRGLKSPNSQNGIFRQRVGDLGERLAIDYEKNRLKKNGQEYLVPLVQRISQIDNSAGYDVMSCVGFGSTPEAPIYIEVKSTVEEYVQFTWSHNEQRVGERLGSKYWIYCFTKIDLDNSCGKGPHKINNPVKKVVSPDYHIETRDIWVKKQ